MTLPGSVLHWFRRDLRTADNRALNRAISLAKKSNLPLIPVFFLDPEYHNPTACGPLRMRFILESISALQRSLDDKCSSRLRVICARPTDVFPDLVRRWGVKHLVFEYEYAPSERARDEAVVADVEGFDVDVVREHGFTLYNPNVLLQKAKGATAPTTMSSFLSLVDDVGDPENPVEFADGRQVELTSCPDATLKDDDKDGYLLVPKLGDIGYEDCTKQTGWERFRGGEEEGIARMDEFLSREGGKVAARFAKPKTSPAAFVKRETTVLSPYLALGCVSSRVFHARLRDLEENHDVAEMPQTRLWGQLMWREHFWLLAGMVPEFHRMNGNPVCRKINWRTGDEAELRLKTWAEARTGYPWIDALMMQLKTEGFVHHLGRHSLACFLTRGDLWVSWEEGYKVFEHYLVDYDYALNSANWMWLSCSAFFSMYFRVYSPVAFAKKWDKEGAFIKHYLPVLRKLPTKYIHEPWKAPAMVQKMAGCVIGKDYPERMVDHSKASKENIAKMKENYARNEYGAERGERQHMNGESRSSESRDSGDGTSRKTKRRKTRR
ncbi:cryptochrome/photolyase [Chondrus crispus]|uniref:Cryptochrome/photolyase n=1 Tax=Chondrus crispus TaxID=2769 RepID=R7QKC4_CHOCR|nr:cryptochrome/photolyase [Chondrus crispus]CDF38223.1 cryptochrome/photolyase [Chondrus crispus]|eukprot:XP_005718107.1 cryptochrome/photolyase [Chondrus crispus]